MTNIHNLNWGIDWKSILPSDGTFKSIGELLYDQAAEENSLVDLYDQYSTMAYAIINGVLYGERWDGVVMRMPS